MPDKQALTHLRKDPILSPIISKHTVSLPTPSLNLFLDLLEAIVSQQLSVRAAATIFRRFQTLLIESRKTQPEIVLGLSEESLRACGLSRQKSLYLKSLAKAVISGGLDLDRLPQLLDEEVIAQLVQVKGIGRWTAEMFLIFSLGRPDIFSLGDLGLCTAVSRLYGVDRAAKDEIEKISKEWSPYRSLASLYLWRSLEDNS